MVQSVDGVVRNFKTLNGKTLFLFNESKYHQLRFLRKSIQIKVFLFE